MSAPAERGPDEIEEDGNDRFYILTWLKLRDLLIREHKAFLEKHDGIHPQRWESLHCGIKEETLRPFLNKWDTIERCLR